MHQNMNTQFNAYQPFYTPSQANPTQPPGLVQQSVYKNSAKQPIDVHQPIQVNATDTYTQIREIPKAFEEPTFTLESYADSKLNSHYSKTTAQKPDKVVYKLNAITQKVDIKHLDHEAVNGKPKETNETNRESRKSSMSDARETKHQIGDNHLDETKESFPPFKQSTTKQGLVIKKQYNHQPEKSLSFFDTKTTSNGLKYEIKQKADIGK